jgi:hypothetical protein
MIDQGCATYDVFISYSRCDVDWVTEELQPQLEAAGLKVLRDETGFEAGLALSLNVQAAVQNSRDMVAVITADWLKSRWTLKEMELQFSKDATGETSRLFALVFEPHEELPQDIQRILYLGCRTVEETSKAISRLLHHLGVSQQQIDKINSEFAEKGLGELRILMKLPVVRKALGGCETVFDQLRAQIQQLGRYKALHDNFERAEDLYKLVYRNLQLVKSSQLDWDDLESSTDLFRDELQHLLQLAADVLSAAERTWSKKLANAQSQLVASVACNDAAALSRPMEQFRETFGREPLRLNDQLVEKATALNLLKPAGILNGIEARLRQVDFDESARQHLTAFRQSLTALMVLDHSLKTLVDQHRILQGLNQELRRYDFLRGVKTLPVEKIVADWQYLKEIVAELDGEQHFQTEWLRMLGVVRDELSRLCADSENTVTGLESNKEIRKQFNRFNDAVSRGLTRVDTDLKNLCERLQTVGDELDGFLGDMQ